MFSNNKILLRLCFWLGQQFSLAVLGALTRIIQKKLMPQLHQRLIQRRGSSTWIIPMLILRLF